MKFSRNVFYPIRLLLCLFVAYSFVTQLSAQRWENPSVLFPGKDSVSVTATDLKGTWIWVSSYFDGSSAGAREDVAPYYLEVPETVIFRGDSLFEYNYPCELKYRHAYVLKNDSITISDTKYSIHLRHDTLSICIITAWYGTRAIDYEVRQYTRGSVDSTIINKLDKQTVNRDCLIGTWELVTTYDSGYDGNGIVNIDFPFDLPRKLRLTPKKLERMMQGNSVMKISTDGTMQPFNFQLSEDGNEIEFSTGEWFPGEWSFTFTYTKKP